MLQVCVSSTLEPLSTSASLRLVLGATATGNDTYQIDLVARASKWAERRVGYPLSVQTYLESVPSYGGLNVMLSRTPIRAVLRFFDSTATCDASAICSTEFRVADADAGLLSRDAGWHWTAGERYYLGKMIVPHSELKPWLVEYIAGYTRDGMETGSGNWSTRGPNGSTSTGRDLPEDLEQAVLLKASEWYRGSPGNVLSESVGDLSVTYAGGSHYRSEAEDLLAPYRRQK